MALSPTERYRLGLDLEPPAGYEDPSGGPATEFLTGGQANSGNVLQLRPPVTEANVRLKLEEGSKASAPKIRALTNELLAGNLANADWALKQLFQVNPKEALKVYLELCEFSMPKLKAVAVAVDDRSDRPQSMTFAQLQQVLNGG